MGYSNNGDYELLIEQITDAIVARLNGDGGDQAAMCGCTSECFHRCPERMHRIVDAGAARIGLVLGQTGSAREWMASPFWTRMDAASRRCSPTCSARWH